MTELRFWQKTVEEHITEALAMGADCAVMRSAIPDGAEGNRVVICVAIALGEATASRLSAFMDSMEVEGDQTDR